MRTVVTLVIDHKKPIADLGKLIEQRAYNLPGIEDVNVIGVASSVDLIALPVVEMPE